MAIFEMKRFLSVSLELYNVSAVTVNGEIPKLPPGNPRDLLGTLGANEESYIELIPVDICS